MQFNGNFFSFKSKTKVDEFEKDQKDEKDTPEVSEKKPHQIINRCDILLLILYV